LHKKAYPARPFFLNRASIPLENQGDGGIRLLAGQAIYE
jgi:hypothetical protein